MNDMTSINSDILEEKKVNPVEKCHKNINKNIYVKDLDIKYEIINPIIKDVQMISLLVKLIKDYRFSDVIFIIGNNSYSVGSRFYFNYRKLVDFYFLVLNFEEKENSLKIAYHVYKTKPISINFYIVVSLSKKEDNSKIEFELIPPEGKIFPEKIVEIINKEIDDNILYLSSALKMKKNNLIYFNSSIIQNEFFVLSQIVQNIKLTEYLINGKLININNINEEIDNDKMKSNDKDKFIHLNEIYKIYSFKQKEENTLSDIYFKIINIKSNEDKLTMNIKVLSDKEKNDSNSNQIYNIISINITKITKNSSFILIKYISESNFNAVKKLLKKFLSKIQKLSDITKNETSF